MLSRRLLLQLGASVGMGLISTAARAAPSAGAVTDLVGEGRIVSGADQKALTKGLPVSVGDAIHTGKNSRAGLKLGTNTIIKLGPSSSLVIESHLVDAGGVLELVQGSMYFEHANSTPAAPRKAEVRSPYGLIAVRGTKFFAGQSRGVFGVFLAEGRVDVSGAGRTVVLNPGYGTDISRPGAAPIPARIWPTDRVREVLLATTGLPSVPR